MCHDDQTQKVYHFVINWISLLKMKLFFPFPGPAQTQRSKLQTGEVRVRFRVPDLQPQPHQRVQPRARHLSLPRRTEEVCHLEHELRVRRLQVRLVQRPRRQGRKHGQVSSGSHSIPALFLSIVISAFSFTYFVSLCKTVFAMISLTRKNSQLLLMFLLWQ